MPTFFPACFQSHKTTPCLTAMYLLTLLVLLLSTPLLQAHHAQYAHHGTHDQHAHDQYVHPEDLPHPVDTSCHPNPCPPTYQCFDSKPSEYRVYCKCRHGCVLDLMTIHHKIYLKHLNQMFRPGFIGDGINSCRRAPTQPPPPPR